MAIPSPQERPDLYDGYDGRPNVTPEQAAQEKLYWDRIAEKAHAAGAAPAKESAPAA